MGSGSKPDCAPESTGEPLKCRPPGLPQTTTSELHGLENLCFFKPTAEFDAAGRETETALDGSSEP